MPYQPIESKADFLRRIKIGTTTEGLHLDFKRGLERKKPDAQAELCRDIAQFANTEGGTLLIGVDEKEGPNGHKVASEVVNVDVSLPPISGHPKKRDNARGVFDVTSKEVAASAPQIFI